MTVAHLQACIASAPPAVPFLTVDGTFDAATTAAHPHLNLSHWPGNTTPAELKHDLSTGIALNYVRLSPAERARLSGDARLVVNNHYDTDGCCAAFAVVRPEEALPLAERLLAVATSGDFFRVPDEDAFCADLVLSGLADPTRSPLGSELVGLADEARYTRALDAALELLPSLCRGDLAPHRDLWERELDELRADRAHLTACEREDVEALDLTVWRARAAGPGGRAPGRHALFGETEADRALYVEETPAGTRLRLVVSTLSWFEIVSHERLPRPDLEALARTLEEREGPASGGVSHWRTQGARNASPELWFGGGGLDSFAEHNGALSTSRLGGAEVEAQVRRHLDRAATR